jgi:enediyne biosynthesis protein E4
MSAVAGRVAVTALLAAAACSSPEPTVPPKAAVPAAEPWFEEVASARGLRFAHQSGHRERYLLPEIMGGGAALFDMDGDGDLDAYLVQSGSVEQPSNKGGGNRLFRNRGDGAFEDVSAGSGAQAPGYGMGVAAGDYDNDGDVDLYVTNLGANVLLQNDGAGRFTDVTARTGVAGGGWSTSAAFVDYDGDGDLDLFVARYIDWSAAGERQCFSLTGVPDYCSPRNYDAPTHDLLFRNDGRGAFSDVTAAAGLSGAAGNGLGVVVADVDDNGRPDIVVANDGTPNHLWINAGGGRFEERGLMSGVALDQDGRAKAGMGVHAADVDGDADEDLLIVNLDGESDSFFRNERAFFVDDTVSVGLRTVSRPLTRFGMALVDFDNDGLLDLYEANGRVGLQSEHHSADPYAEPNVLLRGLTGGRFEPVAQGGLRQPLVATSRAAAFGDIDNDGGIDVLISNRDGPAHLLRNVVPRRGHWLSARVLEEHGRDAFGAVVTVTAGSRTLRTTVRAAYSYMASNDPRIHVGLGADTRIESVAVRWPGSANAESFGPFEADRTVTIRRGSGRPLLQRSSQRP